MQNQSISFRVPVLLLLLLIGGIFNISCGPAPTPEPPTQYDPGPISYLALGDSYTIGEGVDPEERWPVQLAEMLREDGFEIKDPLIIARTGWTTANLQNALDQQQPDADYDLVSLLIGVNNQYQGRTLSEYQIEFEELLLESVRLAAGDTDRVFVVSIPDYGYTPFGASDQQNITREVDEFNAAAKTITESYGIPFYDITPTSRQNKDDYVAGDGLHPSGLQYADWVAVFKDAVARQLIN